MNGPHKRVQDSVKYFGWDVLRKKVILSFIPMYARRVLNFAFSI